MGNRLSFKLMSYLTLIIVIIMAVSFSWDVREQNKQIREELLEKAQLITSQFLAMRHFIAANQDRINYDSDGHFEFKHLNPAAVGGGVAEIFNEKSSYKIKQTRIDFRDGKNAPDEFEKEILHKFAEEKDLIEYWQETILNGQRVFRYLYPLEINTECLDCHGEPKGQIDISGHQKEGYKIGDFGGAISVVLPMNRFLANLQNNIYRDLGFMLLLIGLTLGAIYFIMARMVTNPLTQLRDQTKRFGQGNLEVNTEQINAQGEIKDLTEEFQNMAGQLNELYKNLEQRVAIRTKELAAANKQLEEHHARLELINAELERSNMMKSQFLATMTHELRTPLTAILAFAEVTIGSENLPQQAHNNIKDILEQGSGLLRLINNLLDMAKLEAGHQQLRLIMVDLLDVISAVEAICAPLAERKGIKLIRNIDKNLPMVMGDEEKLQRTFLNLVGNAIKFTPEGGEVKVTVENCHNKEVVVKVKDSGIGMKREQQERIFEMFYQVESSDARRFKGTGLGLALAKEWIDLHGGSVTVDSEPGKGSLFTVILPVSSKGGEIKCLKY